MMEKKILLTTGDNYTAEKKLKIEGTLKSIILKSETSMDIEITSEMGYTIYKQFGHTGTIYFPLKIIARNNNAEKIKDQYEEFVLNEDITVHIKGGRNSAILIILRII